MKAIDKLIELRKTDSSIVAIARDKTGRDYWYSSVPEKCFIGNEWENSDPNSTNGFIGNNILDFGSLNWKECIVTINDLSNYEVKMMSISVQDYERLVQAEKTLENIKKFLS